MLFCGWEVWEQLAQKLLWAHDDAQGSFSAGEVFQGLNSAVLQVFFCLWSVFLVLSCKAYLSQGSKRERNLVFPFIHYLCFTLANCPSGTKLNRTLNYLSLQEKGFERIKLAERCPWGMFSCGKHLLCSFEWKQIQKITKLNVFYISFCICCICSDWGRLI